MRSPSTAPRQARAGLLACASACLAALGCGLGTNPMAATTPGKDTFGAPTDPASRDSQTQFEIDRMQRKTDEANAARTAAPPRTIPPPAAPRYSQFMLHPDRKEERAAIDRALQDERDQAAYREQMTQNQGRVQEAERELAAARQNYDAFLTGAMYSSSTEGLDAARVRMEQAQARLAQLQAGMVPW